MDCLAPKTASMWRIACLVSACLSLAACSESKKEIPGRDYSADGKLPYYETPDFNPHFFGNAAEAEKQISHRIADFTFTDQEGNAVTQADVDGKIHVADFFFTSCGSICPKMTNHMKTIGQAYEGDSDLVLLSYSVMPWVDSVGRLREFAADYGADARSWHMLTGSKSAIYELARKSYFAEQDIGYSKDSTEFLHTEHFILVDKHRRIRGIYNGTLDLEIQQLILDIAALKQEG